LDTDSPIEFLHGRPLEPEELEMIRLQIESGFDDITALDPEVRSDPTTPKQLSRPKANSIQPAGGEIGASSALSSQY